MVSEAGPTGGLSAEERSTLRLVADTFVPSLDVPGDSDGFYRRTASDLGVDADIARIIDSYVTEKERADFHRLLRTFESPALNLVLTGRPRRLSSMSMEERDRYLVGWAASRLAIKRQGFHALKRLVLFLTYAKSPDGGDNPNWPPVGYNPSTADRAVPPHPPEKRIEPIHPEAEISLEADVCVIGSGAGGSVIAAKLAALGDRVIVLEAGPYRTANDFSLREAETYDTMFQKDGVLTTRDLAFSVLAGQTVGGGATINWMTCLRPPSWAREEWGRDAGMAGVATAEFNALLDEVETRLHVNTQESVVNPSNGALRRGCEALGYRAGADYNVIPRNSLGCDARCDFCFFGCRYNAKQAPLLTYLPDAVRAGARFLFDTKANSIAVESGHVRGVEATHGDGKREIPVHVRARAVVAAGSAVQTPALLLRSGIRSPGIGRGLRLDPTTALLAEFPQPIRMWSGPMQTIVVTRFQALDEGHHGPWLESAPAHPGLAASAARWSGGRAHKDAMRRLAHASSTIVLVRDVAEGRVTVDAQGEPVLDYRLTTRAPSGLPRFTIDRARSETEPRRFAIPNSTNFSSRFSGSAFGRTASPCSARIRWARPGPASIRGHRRRIPAANATRSAVSGSATAVSCP